MMKIALLSAAAMLASGAVLAQTGASPTTQPPSSGSQTMMNSEEQVRTRLQSEGYTQVGDIKREGNGWQAKATKDGRQMTLNIDQQGQIKPSGN
jgi:hypothetical protein